MTRPIVAVVHLGRDSALGERARVRSWAMLLDEAGFHPQLVPLRSNHGRYVPAPRQLGSVVAGRAVPESLSWDATNVRHHLEELAPHAVVHVTLRAHHPQVDSGSWITVIDFVDRLSRSYADRASVRRLPARLGFTVLGRAHGRVERLERSVPTTAAGLADAGVLGATWLPNVICVPPPRTRATSHDVVFFGNLAYEPNVAALDDLAEIDRHLQHRRPGTTILVGGANPSPRVVSLCEERNWQLSDGFDDPIAFAALGRVAVAPLTKAAGIQNKVIEAAAADRPQVISPMAASGLDELPPGLVAEGASDFADAIVRILEDPAAFGHANDWARRWFSPQAWVPTLRSVVLQ